ncbi:hypothetical protein [uncultured Bacteroides sp.]|uniref:hypothetical protein n=1 Tax=uncultured Bacteroides sp. TaxID=162156 RepID=UPI00280B043D|nr:hypothetical protein [uncultured Bacteroides sp.]
MEIKEIRNNQTVVVYGVEFHGFEELKKHAFSGESKEGVYVGCDCEGYPCFDSEDYATENRFYWNFVFARNKRELEQKIKLLETCRCGCNYCKLTETTPEVLYPMIYFQGDEIHPLIVMECKDMTSRSK